MYPPSSPVSEKLIENINYKYDLSHNPFVTDASIVLFKASQEVDFVFEEILALEKSGIEELKAIDAYYVNKTDDNYLYDFVICSRVDIVILKSSHSGWVKCDWDMDRIVQAVLL